MYRDPVWFRHCVNWKRASSAYSSLYFSIIFLSFFPTSIHENRRFFSLTRSRKRRNIYLGLFQRWVIVFPAFFLCWKWLSSYNVIVHIWAVSWQNQQNDSAPSEDSDQTGRITQINLGIRPVWSVFACAQWVAKDPSFLHADSENSDQTGRMPRLIWVFAGRTCHFVGFVMRRLILLAFSNLIHMQGAMDSHIAPC